MRVRVTVIAVVMLCFGFSANAFAKDDNWGGVSLAPKLGYAWFQETDGGELDGDNVNIPARNAVNLHVQVDFGGGGPGFDLAFVYSYEHPDYGGAMHALGTYMGFSYRFNIDGRAYPYVGAGMRIAYLMGGNVEHGVELYGRVPIGFNYYVLEDLGLFFEAGPGYGAIGVLPKSLTGQSASFGFGHGFFVDAMAGIRFP